jgi:hypothetical protein
MSIDKSSTGGKGNKGKKENKNAKEEVTLAKDPSFD